MSVKAWFGKQCDSILVGLIVAVGAAAILGTLALAYSLFTSESALSFLKGDTGLPVWGFLLVFSLGCGFTFWLLMSRHQSKTLTAKVTSLQAEIDELKNPTQPPLDQNDIELIYAVAVLYDIEREWAAVDIAKALEISPTKIQTIADKLKRIGLLHRRTRLDSPLRLTVAGRAYIDQPDTFEDYSEFSRGFIQAVETYQKA